MRVEICDFRITQFGGMLALMAKMKRTGSTPGPKPSPRSFSLLLPIRVNGPMMDALKKGDRRKLGPHALARAMLVQAMLDKGMISTVDLPE